MATRAESAAATRSDLLGAAREVFVERGYHGASLELVARAAGYTKGAVYSAFGSKAKMFLAVYEREVGDRWDRIEAETADLPADAVRAGGTHDWFRRIRAERAWTLCLLEFRLHAAREPALNAVYAEAHSRVVDRVAGMLRRAGVDPGLSRARAVDLVALSNGYALEHLVLPGEATEERYAAASAAVIERR
jgi:AcrR family transcriptional regulator